MKSPFKKILVSFSQSNFGYLIYFYHKVFDSAEEANMHPIKSRRLGPQW